MVELQRDKSKDETPSEVQGLVHKVGDAEIIHTRQGDISVIAVKGKYSVELMQMLERLVLRTRTDVGLDLKDFRAPGQVIVPQLRKMNKHFKANGKVFLLYHPPTFVTDHLRLLNCLDEFNLYTPTGDLVVKTTPDSAAAGAASGRGDSATAPQRIVQFTTNLQRARQLESSIETAGRRSLLMARTDLPEFAPYEMVSSYIPHDKLGGDFLHVQTLDDDSLGVSIGDVSGHGVEAALVMGMTKKVLEIRAREGSRNDVRAVMTRVNEDVFPDLDHFTFVTSLYGILRRSDDSFTYARAGHNYPLLISANDGAATLLSAPGMALGMDRGPMFQSVLKQGRVVLDPGDLLVIYTDGLTEAAQQRRGQFGMERLAQYFREANRDRPLPEIQERLFQTLYGFLQGDPLQDDLTLLLIRHAR